MHCLFYNHKNVTFCLLGRPAGAMRFFKPIDFRFQFFDEFGIAILSVYDHPNHRRKEAIKNKAQWILRAGEYFAAKHQHAQQRSEGSGFRGLPVT